ncbi:MAG TPA: Wzz/FepE/Etk N-terminal domain-containing protein [Anaerolineae bacterium]|nr:Wzz/FepE/Etk N-terminal domain-containing protein [Anaerolineae bacterium]
MNSTNQSNLNPFPDELNLGRYLAVLRKHWRLVLLCGVLGAVLAFLVLTILPKTYQSEADLVIIRTGTIVNLDPKLQTVSDPALNGDLSQLVQRSSLTAIATNPDFATTILGKIGTQLPEDLNTPTELLKRVDVRADRDVIRISATMNTAELAALVANTWAAAYQERLNQLFNENPDTPAVVRVQADAAKKEYDAKEAALIAFLGNNSISRLTQQKTLIQQQLASQVTVVDKLIQLEADAKALRGRVSAGPATPLGTGNDPGTQLTQLLIQANAFTNGGDLPLRLDVTAPNSGATTQAEQLQQLDSLIAAIQARRQALSGDAEESLQVQLATVTAQLEQAQAQQRELQAARDLAWNTYQLLMNKVAERSISTGVENQFVRVGAAAIVPTEPRESHRLLGSLIGAVLGLLVGGVLAFIWEALPQRVPQLQRAS